MKQLQIVLIVATMMVIFPGCEMGSSSPKPVSAPPAAPATPTAAPATAEVEMCVLVDGKGIPQARLAEALMDDYGMDVTYQLVADELVRQAILKAQRPYPVAEKELWEMSERMFRRQFQFKESTPRKEIENVLDQYLAKDKKSRRQWDSAMARNIRLRRLLKGRRSVKVTEADLKDAYRYLHDCQLSCRHIQVPDLATAEKVKKLLEAGSDFKAVALKYSTAPSAKEGGKLPTMGTKTNPNNIPIAILQAARALGKVGEISNPVQAGSNFHILQMTGIKPATNEPYDKMLPALRSFVREEKLVYAQAQLLQELMKKADVKFVHPTLELKHKEIERNSRLP